MKSMKSFIPFPVVDNNYEREQVVYYPSKWSSNTPPNNSKLSDKLVCVTNRIRATGISLAITQADLYEVFSPFGPIVAINIIRNRFRHRNGIAFITYCDTIHAQLALQISSPIYLKGNRIYTHQAIQKPKHVNYMVKPIHRRSMKASRPKVEECKYLSLQKDNDGSTPNPTCSSIDSNVLPPIQHSTKSSCTHSSTKTCSSIRDNAQSLCGEESKELLAISESCESTIQNSQEFNCVNFHKIPNGVYPAVQGYNVNPSSLENLEYFNCYERENVATNYTTYYGINQMVYQLPHYGGVPGQQNFNYSYDCYDYSLPTTDVNYNPFYVNTYMYQKNFGSKDNPNASERENNQFHQLSSPLYECLPVAYENESYNEAQNFDLPYYNKEQPITSQETKSQVHVVHKSKMKDQSLDKVKITNVLNKQSITQASTSDDKVEVSSNKAIPKEEQYASDYKVHVSSNKGKPEEPYLSSYQQYSSDDKVEVSSNKGKPKEPHLSSYQQYASNDNVDVSPNKGKPKEPSFSSYQQYASDAKVDVSSNKGKPNEPCLSSHQQYASDDKVDISSNKDKPKKPCLSSYQQYASNYKIDISSNKGISEEPYLSSYQQYAESFVESARQLAAFEEQFSDAPFQFLQPEEDDEPTEYSKLQSRFLQYNLKRNTGDSNEFFISSDSDDGITVEIEQFQDYEKYLKISRGDTRDCGTSNQFNLLETMQTVIEQNTSLNKEVSHLDKSEDLSNCTSNQLDVLETTEAVIEQSTSLNKEELKPKVSDESEDTDAIVEISIESGFYLVQVRDVATQFPEYDKNLSKTSTPRVVEPSFSNIETQTCTAINKDEKPEMFSSTNTSVAKVKNKRNNFSKKRKSKQQRSK